MGAIHGFGSISRRTASCKPLIAAVIGGARGGGVEILLNCDLVIAADDATFALPEVKVGATAALGGMLLPSSLLSQPCDMPFVLSPHVPSYRLTVPATGVPPTLRYMFLGLHPFLLKLVFFDTFFLPFP